MGCFESKCEILYEYPLFKPVLETTKRTKNKHICSKEFKNYLKNNSLEFDYYNVVYKSFNNSCICDLYIKCYICNKKHISLNTVYCSLCKKCVINNLYYHCYDCDKCKPIFINHCKMLQKNIT